MISVKKERNNMKFWAAIILIQIKKMKHISILFSNIGDG